MRRFLEAVLEAVSKEFEVNKEEVWINDENIVDLLKQEFSPSKDKLRNNNKQINIYTAKNKADWNQNRILIYTFKWDYIPSQCGTVMIYNARLYRKQLGKHIPSLLDLFLHMASFSTALCSCTCNKMNTILSKNGWKRLMKFRNCNSGNIVTWWGYERKSL